MALRQRHVHGVHCLIVAIPPRRPDGRVTMIVTSRGREVRKDSYDGGSTSLLRLLPALDRDGGTPSTSSGLGWPCGNDREPSRRDSGSCQRVSLRRISVDSPRWTRSVPLNLR